MSSETYALHPGSLTGCSDDALREEAARRGMTVVDAVEAARRRDAIEASDEFLRWLVALDDVDGPGAEARRTVRLNDIITKARALLSADAEKDQP